MHLFIEAESFDHLGGWVVDPQSMEQLGSSYVMAHGMGTPVTDACTEVEIPRAGTWRFWARTRDWSAPWQRGTPAGRFQLLVGGQALPAKLGTCGEKWAWQLAGEAGLPAGRVRLALRDLTGFNGRCDAIFASPDGETPPDDRPALDALRRAFAGPVEDDPQVYDLVVCGGGMAGVCAALAALRKGLSVALLQDREVLGGCNSSEVRVPLGGFAQCEPYPALGSTVSDIEPAVGWPGHYPAEFYEDTRKYHALLREEWKLGAARPAGRLCMALRRHVVAAETEGADAGGRPVIAAVIARDTHTGRDRRYRGRLFADCTGDAVLSRLLGAAVMYGREGRDDFGESLAPAKADRLVMGHSILWGSEETGAPVEFPDIDWGYEFNDGNAYRIFSGDWEQEAGQLRDQVAEIEYIRDFGLMTIYGNWSWLKNHAGDRDAWRNRRLTWVSPIGGKRESYRAVGDYVISQRDIEERLPHPDGTVAMTWNIDLHVPDPDNLRRFPEPFRSCAYHRNIGAPYQIPYRCLCSRDIANLFLGGRQISATHVAFACIRVMRTLGALGEVIGLAASLAVEHDATPREIGQRHWDELDALMQTGVPRMPCHAWLPRDRSDNYHFKELGHLPVGPDRTVKGPPGLAARIAAIGAPHTCA